MALPAPPPRPAPLAAPPSALPAPPPRRARLAAPPPAPADVPRHIVEADDLPYVAPGSTVPGNVAPSTAPARTSGFLGNARALEQAARVGLVLAIVVALAGVVGAFTKSGDDGSTRVASRGGTAIADEDPLAEDTDSTATTVEPEDPYLVPDGYQVVQADGIYLSVPASWKTLSPRTMERMFDDETLDEIYPDLDPELRSAMEAALDQGVIFMAIDPDPAGEGRNLNIMSMPGEAPLDEVAEVAERELEGAGFGVEIQSSREVDTPIGRAVRVAYSAEVVGYRFDAVQYYIPADGRTYVITGTAADDITDQAVQTLRLGEAPTPA